MRKLQWVLVFAFCAVMTAPVMALSKGGDDREEAKTDIATNALKAMERGDNWIGTNLFRKAAARDGTPLNRFNLATGYMRTGRLEEAKRLFQSVLDSSQRLVSSPMKGVRGGGVRVFDIGEEAASRLAFISWKQSQTASMAAAQVSEPGQTVSAEAAATNSAYSDLSTDVSDEQAAALDRAARAERRR